MEDPSGKSFGRRGQNRQSRRETLFERQSWLKRFIPAALILFLAIGLALKAPKDSIYQYIALAVVLTFGMFTMGFLVKGLQEHGFTISGCLLTLLTIAVGAGIIIGINLVL